MTVELYLGDCLEILPTLEDDSVNAVVTDPPWKDYVTGWYDASKWHKEVAFVDPDSYASQLFRLTKTNGAIILWVGWQSFDFHSRAFSEAGYIVKNCIVWAKPNHTAGDLNGNFGYQHEMAVFATKENWRVIGNRPTNLWRLPHLFSKTKRFHPTQKPINLMIKSIESISKPNDIILDPFMGSGTTGVACVQTGRDFVGIEIEPKYFEIAETRIRRAEKNAQIEKKWLHK